MLVDSVALPLINFGREHPRKLIEHSFNGVTNVVVASDCS
jgi:hypothetical protein